MLDQLVREVQTALEEAARDSLASGWAELRSSQEVGPTLHLEPMKMSAAPLEVHFDSDELILCTPGRNAMLCEFFAEDCDDLPGAVRALAAAVVAGEYRERLKEGSVQIEAEWPGPDGPELVQHDVLEMPGAEKRDWRQIDYDPY
jgi:hypothetical protein